MSKGFTERKNIFFIGGFAHTPNIDAVKYFIKDILPYVIKKLPDVKFIIVGSNIPSEILSLANENVIVKGFVKNIEPLFSDCKLMIVPLRYGAGVKGKITQCLSYGLPLVTTSIGAESTEIIDGQSGMISDLPEEFAEKIIALYSKQTLWENISKNSLLLSSKFSPENALESLKIGISTILND